MNIKHFFYALIYLTSVDKIVQNTWVPTSQTRVLSVSCLKYHSGEKGFASHMGQGHEHYPVPWRGRMCNTH